MKITSIEKLKVKYKIEFDNGKKLYVSENTIIEYGLIKKMELTDLQVKTIMRTESIELAYSKAISYLQFGLRTEEDMREYLAKKEFSPDNIDEAIIRLKEIGYINDEHYIEAAVMDYFNINKRGPYWIKRKLEQKGLDKEKIAANIEKICTEEKIIDTLYAIIEREYSVRRETKNKKIQKITQKLYTNGYSFDIIKTVFNIFFEDYEEDDNNDLDLLETHYTRAYNSYYRRYPDKYKLKQKIIEKLMRDGFNYSDIKDYLAEQEL